MGRGFIMTQQDTYQPFQKYNPLETIAYDFGYKEGQIGNLFWAENVSDILQRIISIYLEFLWRMAEDVALAYAYGYSAGSGIQFYDLPEDPTQMAYDFADTVTTSIGSANPEEMNEYPD
jgi:hypothetical protein